METTLALARKKKHDKGLHTHICPYSDCNKAFSRSFRLTQHIRSHTGERPFVCEVEGCTKSYSRAAHLKRHQDTAHCSDSEDGEEFRCPHKGCKQTFVNRTNLLKHTQRKHQILPKYKCKEDGCVQVFNKKSRLRAHTYEHLGVLPFQCHHKGCKMRYKQKSHLERHLKNHEGHHCTHQGCELWFPKWSLARRHITVDHKQVYTCQQCQKSLPTKAMLREHRDTHLDARDKCVCPYEGCPRSYFVKRNLTAHIKSYHLGKRFKCEKENCGRTFATKQKLQSHEKLHDPNRPLPKKKPKKKAISLVLTNAIGYKDKRVPPAAVDVLVRESDEDVISVQPATSSAAKTAQETLPASVSINSAVSTNSVPVEMSMETNIRNSNAMGICTEMPVETPVELTSLDSAILPDLLPVSQTPRDLQAGCLLNNPQVILSEMESSFDKGSKSCSPDPDPQTCSDVLTIECNLGRVSDQVECAREDSQNRARD